MGKEENKRLSSFDKLMQDVKGVHSKRLNAMLVTMDDEDFALNYFKILEYAAPKLQRQEIVEEEKDFVVTLEHTYRSKEKYNGDVTNVEDEV